MASSFFHFENSSSTSGATIWMPALLIRISRRPKVSSTRAMPASTCSSLLTSISIPSARFPSGSISEAVSSAAFRSRPAITTFAPSLAKVIAISLPIPLAAPVITATLSRRRPRRAVLGAGSPDKASICKFMGSSFLIKRLRIALGTHGQPRRARASDPPRGAALRPPLGRATPRPGPAHATKD